MSMVGNSSSTRFLSKNELGGVIFGCTRDTMTECLVHQLFGLPGQHFSYVQNIEPGLPLFLFNYSDRKLYGIYEAEGCGQWNIDPYGWSSNGSEKTKYPAQVRIRTRMQCEPLLEKQFKPIIADNYYTGGRFCFELDRTQANALISLYGSSTVNGSLPVIGGSTKISLYGSSPVVSSLPVTGGSSKWVPKVDPNSDAAFEVKDSPPPVLKEDFNSLDQFKMRPGVSSDTSCIDGHSQLLQTHRSDQSKTKRGVSSDTLSIDGHSQLLETHTVSEDVDDVEDVEEIVYEKLKNLALERSCTNLSAMGHATDIAVPSNTHPELAVDDNSPEIRLDAVDKNEETSTFDLQSVVYQLSLGIKKLKAFSKEQLQKTSLMEQKMRFAPASAVLTGALYAVGGYDGADYLASVERFDPRTTSWEYVPSMNTRRGCHSLVIFNEKLYAIGGYDGAGTVSSVEVLDPRFGSWTCRDPMNISRGYAGAAVIGDSIYVIGGLQAGPNIVDTVECYREDSGWMVTNSTVIGKRCFSSSVVLRGHT